MFHFSSFLNAVQCTLNYTVNVISLLSLILTQWYKIKLLKIDNLLHSHDLYMLFSTKLCTVRLATLFIIWISCDMIYFVWWMGWFTITFQAYEQIFFLQQYFRCSSKKNIENINMFNGPLAHNKETVRIS